MAQNDTTDIPFKVSARTARLIGRENVANSESAVIELVKNGYDADSKNVWVCFMNSDLYIVDNGHGMSREALINGWMVIGTDNKLVSPLTPNKRVRSGAKGIGRFALDKLGQETEMFTMTPDGRDALLWQVKWGDFETQNTTVDGVTARLSSASRKEVLSELKRLTGDEHSSGTIIKISKLRDSWSRDNYDKLFNSLRSLVPPRGDSDFTLQMKVDKYPKDYGVVENLAVSEYDYELSVEYISESQEVSYELKRNEFDNHRLLSKFEEVFEQKGMGEFPFDRSTFEAGSYLGTVPITSLMPGLDKTSAELNNIGSFNFHIIFAKNTKPNDEDFDKYPYKTTNYKARAEWLKRFGGIRIYRDNFRVRPYGENGSDWLGLGERQAQSPGGPGQRLGGYRVRPNQIAGSIYISRIKNITLEDKSSREGIVENSTFTLLKNIIIAMLSIIENDRNQVFYSLSERYKKVNKTEHIKQQGQDAVLQIKKIYNDKEQSHDEEAKQEYAERIADYVEVLENQDVEKSEEIKILRSLASAGIITAAAAHELNALKNHMTVRTKQFERLLEDNLDRQNFTHLSPANDPFKRLEQMAVSDKKIVTWLNYALMPLRRDRRLRNKVQINSYLEGLSEVWRPLLETRKIKLEINAETADDCAVKVFPIDLDTIFNNLLINSTEAFATRKNIVERYVRISTTISDDNLRIVYEDNAGGLDPSLKEQPDKIFLPHVSTKLNALGEATGTGMGMYLVKSVVDENDGTAYIDLHDERFDLKIELPVYAQ